MDSTVTTWHVTLDDGQRFAIGWSAYRKLNIGDRIEIAYYPNSGLVTDVRNLEADGAS